MGVVKNKRNIYTQSNPFYISIQYEWALLTLIPSDLILCICVYIYILFVCLFVLNTNAIMQWETCYVFDSSNNYGHSSMFICTKSMYFVCVCVCVCVCCFLGTHLWHMEVPRLAVELELQQPAYTKATAMWILATSATYPTAHGNVGSDPESPEQSQGSSLNTHGS